MAELGLFSPRNPVTSYTPAQAAADVITGDPAGLCPPVGFLPVTGELPPELQGKGYVRARDYTKAHPVTWRTHIEGLICGATIFKDNPWVDGASGFTLERHADGRYLLIEGPCLVGWGHPEYRVRDLEGKDVCSRVPLVPDPKDPALPPAQPGAGPFSGLGPYGFGDPLQKGQGSHFGVSVAGVNPLDVLKFLQGAGVQVDLSGVLAVLASLVVQGGNIRSSLDDLPVGLRDLLGPQLEGFGLALDRLVPGVGVRLAQALDQHGTKQADGVRDAAASVAGAVVPVWGPLFAEMVRQGPEVLAKLAGQYRDAAADLSRRLLELFRRDLEEFGEIRPDNVDQVAGRVLGSAITAGTAAQLAGMALELLHPIKSLGVQQAIGVLAQFAGFGEIVKPFFGATLRYGLALPAEHRAAAHFRTALPPEPAVKLLAAAGQVPPAKYLERLELAGYPKPYPEAFLQHLYSELSPRALAAFTDGSEADRGWLADKLRYFGLSPEDARRGVRALELKATQPGRQKLVAVLLTAFKAGQLEQPDLEAGLDGAGLSLTHRAYYTRAALLERRGDRMENLGTQILEQFRTNILSVDATRQLLAGLGFSEDEVNVRLAVTELKQGAKQVTDEEKALETELRQLKAQGLKLALLQARAGFLEPRLFLAVGTGMGYSPAYLRVALELERGKGTPKTTKAAPAIGAGALEEVQARIAAVVAEQVTARQTSRVAAVVSLRVAGIPDDLASELVLLADAIAGPSALGGDYGNRAGGKGGVGFAGVLETVLGGLAGLGQPQDLVLQLFSALGLPGRDRAALTRLIQDLRDLFRGR